jgi:hypothetical protein
MPDTDYDSLPSLAPIDPEPVARIVYASQANLQGSVYAEMERIRAAALRHNVPAGVHTALLHQSGWFVQWKEGPGHALLRIMDKVGADARHHSMRIVHSSRGPRLLAGPWSMAIVQCDETPADMTMRVAALRRGLESGHQYDPPAVWRQLSTPLRHPGAADVALNDAFQRLLVCAAQGDEAFDLVRWLAHRNDEEVVHRRFAGAADLDVGTDLVDFRFADRTLRVIAMARKGLAVPLTRAFLPDYSHAVLLLCGQSERDLALVHKVAHACATLVRPPVLVGIAAHEASHAQPLALANELGLAYQPEMAEPQSSLAVWSALLPSLTSWRAETAGRLAVEAPADVMR